MLKVLLHTIDDEFKEDFIEQMTSLMEGIVFVEDAPDAIIVDDQPEIGEDFRKEFPAVPILFLTSTAPKNDDDFLNITIKKPFEISKLIDVLSAANHKLDNSKEGYLFFNGYELRPKNKEIIDNESNITIKLTEREVDILKYLYKTSDAYVSKTDLQKNVWQYSENVTTHTIETHIYRVRQKVETPCGRKLILTNNGCYKLNVD